MGRAWPVLPFLLALLAVGCGAKRASEGKCAPCRQGAPGASSMTAKPGTSAGARPGPLTSTPTHAAPRSPRGPSILAAAKAYTTHAACVAEVGGALPPELTREADPANLAERICQTRRALSERNVSLCDEIQDSAWPAACRRLYAEALGLPDACPARVPRARGREPACVALASRDPRLCRAIRRAEARARCQAILGAATACRAEGSSAAERACRRDRLRWRDVIQPVTSSVGPTIKASTTLSITPAGGPPAPLLTRALDRGVVVSTRGRVGLRLEARGPLVGSSAVPPGTASAGRRPGALPPRLRPPASRPSMAGSPRATPGGASTRPHHAAAPTGRRPVSETALRPTLGAPAATLPRVSLWLDLARARPGTFRVGAGRGPVRVCGLVGDQWVGPGRIQVAGTLQIDALSRRRGGALKARLRVRIGGAGGLQIESTVVTFVRDVVPPGWLAGGCARFLDRLRASISGAARAGRPVSPRDRAARPQGPQGPGDAGARPCYFVAHWDGLAKTGYRVYGVRPGGACAKLGLADQDVVRRVQGKPMRTWTDVETLYRLLSARGPLRLRVRRGGRAVTLRRP